MEGEVKFGVLKLDIQKCPPGVIIQGSTCIFKQATVFDLSINSCLTDKISLKQLSHYHGGYKIEMVIMEYPSAVIVANYFSA